MKTPNMYIGNYTDNKNGRAIQLPVFADNYLAAITAAKKVLTYANYTFNGVTFRQPKHA